MNLTFSTLTLDHREPFQSLLESTPRQASDYSFVNAFAWHHERAYEVAFEGGLCWLRLTNPEPVLWAPIGPWYDVNWQEVLTNRFPSGAFFDRVPEDLALHLHRQLGERIVLEEERSEWEYLYSREELVDLRGNRFHKKKNLLKQFEKSYDFDYRPITHETVALIISMQKEWCSWKNCDDSPGLKAENDAIFRILENWDQFPGILGGSLFVDDSMVAYTVAEALGDTLIIHFEKGLTEYKGVYQAINQMFLEHAGESFRQVNREQDMGQEGIRKAKMSYNPVDFLKKYTVTWRP